MTIYETEFKFVKKELIDKRMDLDMPFLCEIAYQLKRIADILEIGRKIG